ncbi:MAG: hypothetical protein ABL888_17925 [Pirellulaceae bacterium]
MKRKIALFSVLLVACLSVTVSAQGTADLQGDWVVASGTLAGQPVPANSLESMSLKINGSNFDAKSGSLTSGGTIALVQEGGYQLNFIISRGADSGKTVRALYRFADNILTITYSQDPAAFPIDHTSTAANKYCMLTYRKGSQGDETVVVQGEGNSEGASATFAK